MKLLSHLIIIICCFIFFHSIVFSQDSNYVLNNYYKAIGGKDKLLSVQIFKIQRKDSLFINSFTNIRKETPELIFKHIYVKKENYRLDSSFDKDRKRKQSTFIISNEDTWFIKFPSQVIMNLPSTKENIIHSCRWFINYLPYIAQLSGVKIDYKGIVIKHNKKFYLLNITAPKSDRHINYFFDINNFLLTYSENGTQSYTYYDKYKNVNGVLIPHLIIDYNTKSNQIEDKCEIISVEFNSFIKDEEFDISQYKK